MLLSIFTRQKMTHMWIHVMCCTTRLHTMHDDQHSPASFVVQWKSCCCCHRKDVLLLLLLFFLSAHHLNHLFLFWTHTFIIIRWGTRSYSFGFTWALYLYCYLQKIYEKGCKGFDAIKKKTFHQGAKYFCRRARFGLRATISLPLV